SAASRSFIPVLVVGVVIVILVEVVDVGVFIFFGLLFLAVLVLLFLVVFVVPFEFQRIEAGHTEAAATRFAVPGIAELHFFEIVFVDNHLGVTFGAGRHTLSYAGRASVDIRSDVASARTDYSEALETVAKGFRCQPRR